MPSAVRFEWCGAMKDTIMIRRATIADIKEIHALLSHYAQRGLLLGRSLSDLYDQMRDFVVACDRTTHAVIGVCGLHICWEDIAEIRSLAVRDDALRRGIGTALVAACLREASDLGIQRIFVLTYSPDFFKKAGFEPVDKTVLPHKVWGDCIKCVKFPYCDEEAMMIHLPVPDRPPA